MCPMSIGLPTFTHIAKSWLTVVECESRFVGSANQHLKWASRIPQQFSDETNFYQGCTRNTYQYFYQSSYLNRTFKWLYVNIIWHDIFRSCKKYSKRVIYCINFLAGVDYIRTSSELLFHQYRIHENYEAAIPSANKILTVETSSTIHLNNSRDSDFDNQSSPLQFNDGSWLLQYQPHRWHAFYSTAQIMWLNNDIKISL